jgi:putative restriction endonuclease
MKLGQKLWTREELILAINLYFKTPFGQIHNRNPEIILLAKLIGRTPSSVSYKLVNLASLDPSIRDSGRKGAENASKLDREIWNEFNNDWESRTFESERLLASYSQTTIERLNNISEDDLPTEGTMREKVVKVRVGQRIFRKMILSSYENKCCITGISQPELLVAGHIKPWSLEEKNRLNPSNGLCLNSLHDRAFEYGYITIDHNYEIKVSSELKKQSSNKSIQDNFLQYENQTIILPSRFLPSLEFLKYHSEARFKK